MAFRGDLEALILGALQNGPMHGYAISKRIEQSSEGCLRFGEGQLYPALHKLEEQGMISSEWFFVEGKPSRKTYAVTEKGLTELVRHQRVWAQFVDGVAKVLRPSNGDETHASLDKRVSTGARKKLI